ncbi:hypothetical protein [Limosilactobacillus reuteri]|jgi:hypothetical protein|uniref:Uncharacterized protein n=1 Tax=Limosilactobacillus reuteri TD1 TaxID=1358027 RepID=S5NEP3_LIMRT|nr:hypothetical protein [Limosilactobacillus reuteri]AGR65274.1 hypothetical protein N134_06310 [Limosilactobacillus reuteri TD1]MCC4344734.1 hypothetical protein [Limosilactobacillus reuteri]MCC4358531.1 hypothetical protein [Limosilactobacillus reuteri]MCC4363196.1 hypothetical protein [Limosilactobacillus reuteri]MCC4365036.1 hypothetical protein [Limosilactobacillus reuteri]
MKEYLFSFARPNGSIAYYRISATDNRDVIDSVRRVLRLLEEYWRNNNAHLRSYNP